MIVRRVDDIVWQSDYEYAIKHGNEYDYVISVAKECKHPRASLWIPQDDNVYIPADRYVTVYNFIKQHDNGKSKFLIHCCAGMSRSVAYSIAYLVLRYGITVSEAKRRMGINYMLHPDIEKSLVM
ncbi:putative dual specificity phosphatase [Sulfolobales Beppu filamentous virus 3]|uniref:Putative dual specificity phosphatase n=1 Tax=Sulfolobales Beppu filamentous virus 3 TaxID=2493124 RepID=A0A3Q8Q3X3_9VIRU|nr:putative dual specificity phosphatase [Sulfolobales Beppu filamentous virus 3]AZI75876.1 putative dual specificity phosphatase [Sulfolobales Beppu filamentous virus 3]